MDGKQNRSTVGSPPSPEIAENWDHHLGPAPSSLFKGAVGEILRELAVGEERSVSDLVTATGLSQPNVSNHLARLKARGQVLCRRVGRMTLYRLATHSIAYLVVTQTPVQTQSHGEELELAYRERLEKAVLREREEDAARICDAALAAGLTWRELYLKVLTPVMHHVGDLWSAGEISVAQEHSITAIIVRLLHRLSLHLPSTAGPDAPSAVVACVEGELHTMGGRMAADFLIADGWRVWFLDGYLPLDALMEAVHRHLPDAVLLCATTPHAFDSLDRTLSRLVKWRGEQPLPQLVAGGQLFETLTSHDQADLSGTDLASIASELRRRVSNIRDRR